MIYYAIPFETAEVLLLAECLEMQKRNMMNRLTREKTDTGAHGDARQQQEKKTTPNNGEATTA